MATKQNQEPQVTTIANLKEYAKGTLVQLPDFAEDMPFFARVRRPSMLAMVKNKKIPNALMVTANRLFASDGGMDLSNEAAMDEMYAIFDIICEACFVEPSWHDLKEAEVELTDEQYIAIFNYTQSGVKALEGFRKERTDTGNNSTGKTVQQNTK